MSVGFSPTQWSIQQVDNTAGAATFLNFGPLSTGTFVRGIVWNGVASGIGTNLFGVAFGTRAAASAAEMDVGISLVAGSTTVPQTARWGIGTTASPSAWIPIMRYVTASHRYLHVLVDAAPGVSLTGFISVEFGEPAPTQPPREP